MKNNLGLILVSLALTSASAYLLIFPVLARQIFTISLVENSQSIANRTFLSATLPRIKEVSKAPKNATLNFVTSSPKRYVKDSYITIRSQQEVIQKENAAAFQRLTKYANTKNLYKRPIGEIMQATAQAFLGTPYKAGLLDQSSQETLVVTLNKFDCVLFVETVLAIARGVAVQDYSYQTFVAHIRDQRYWNGYMNGYCSRLHYFSEWIADNQRRGNVQNITKYLGGVALNKTLNFMSQHRSKYPRLVNNQANYKCIVETEANLARLTVDYIPQSQIRHVYAQLQPGDIVGVATNISGLDVTHTGLVYRYSNGNIGLIHASPIGKVTISSDLQRYVGNIKNANGILVARPIDPRQTTTATKPSDRL